MTARLRAALAAPVDVASLAVFRILFGLLMAAAMLRSLARGFVRELYVEPTFHFTWSTFPWVRPWPGEGMYLHFAALAVLALGVAAGFCYRACIVLFFVGFTYVELIDKAAYLNHYYLVSLLAGLMMLMPLGRALSIDARLRPATRVESVPAWMLHALRIQVGVVYFFAGLAKLNPDWLLEAQPLRLWLAARADLPLIGPLLARPEAAYAASWAGALFDLAIVWLLLAPRTRRLAYALVVAFHVATAALFPIGIFPWLMIAAATLFFSPSWPRRLRGGAAAPADPPPRPRPPGPLVPAVLAAHCLVQLLLPLRQHLAPGPSAWSYQGFHFAWNVMLAEKAGHVELRAREPDTGRTWAVPVREHVTPLQEAMLAQDPEMVRALARHVAAQHRARTGRRLEVRADAFATLNGRPSRRLIDPAVDLAAHTAAGWILPLE